MILAACEGRGNGEKDAKGLARAESREGSGRWGGWTGRRGDGEGWMATGRGRQGGRIWKGAMGRERWGGEQQGWEEGGSGEGGNGERGEDGKEAMGRVERGKRWGRAWGEEGARDFTDGYDGMPGWTSAIGLINGCKQIECLG